MQIILISGLSGSGKSIALNVLEDGGFYCVDNLPVPLLDALISQAEAAGTQQLAVAIDMRSGLGIADLPARVKQMKAAGANLKFIFLEARDETLIARFSETRRRHPLVDDATTLGEAIARERDLLEDLAALGHRIDTSRAHPNSLRAWVREFVELTGAGGLTLLFESFGFKHGLPLDADMVFDVRCLPNPHYDPELRVLTGRDGPVVQFLEAQEDVGKMLEDIRKLVADWLPCYARDNRSYLTVAIGCTGGQHRSVYFVEQLARAFREKARVLVRHRTLQ